MHKRLRKIKEFDVNSDEDAIERQRKQEDAWQAAEMIVNAMLEGYKNGEIGFENLCRLVEKALRPEPIGHLRLVTLGKIIVRAIKMSPPKRKSGRPRKFTWVSEVSAELCEAVKEKEGLPIIRKSLNSQTVFERVVDIMKFRGIHVTASQVERNYNEYKNRLRK